MRAHHRHLLERSVNRAGLSPQSFQRGITKMFIVIRGHRHGHSELSHPGSPTTSMNVGLGYGLLVSLIATVLLVIALSGTRSRPFISPNNDHERSGFSTPPAAAAQGLRDTTAPAHVGSSVSANETPRWRSDIMDSYESVPSLAALAKQGRTAARLGSAVAERQAEVPPGIKP